MQLEPKPFYSPGEVAEILGVSVSYINSRIERHEIDAIRLSPRVTRIPYGVLQSLIGKPLSVTVEQRSAQERQDERDELLGEDVPSPTRHLVMG
jgi:excisionase family DNA binding protein